MRLGLRGRQFLGVTALLFLLTYAPGPGGKTRLAPWLSHHFYLALGGRSANSSPPVGGDPLRSVLQSENDRLHTLLALRKRLSGEVRTARVVRREADRWWSELVVEMSISGPSPPLGTALVITPEGLIGTLESQQLVLTQVADTGLARGTVALLSTPGHQLSVLVGGAEHPFLLEGRGGPRLALRPVSGEAEKKIAPSDAVLTSGLGQIYSSRGLRVAEVESEVHWAHFSALSSTPTEVLLWWR